MQEARGMCGWRVLKYSEHQQQKYSRAGSNYRNWEITWLEAR